MSDEAYREEGMRKEQMREEVEKVVGFIKENVFVKIGV